jgi:hypothetical protein
MKSAEASGSLKGDLPWLALLLTACAVLGANYIFRTSIDLGDSRVFVLWDDAMISMQYARNLAEGNGLVWSPDDEAVQGITNLGVTLIMSAIHTLPVDESRTSAVFQGLNLAALLGIILLGHQLASFGLRRDRGLNLSVAAMVALCFPLQVMTLQGSDTGLIALWLLGCHLVFVRMLEQQQPRTPWFLFLLLAVGPILRLDSLIYALPLLAGTARLPGAALPRLALGAALLAGVVAALLLFGVFYYGDPLPNTYYLKATGQPKLLMLTMGAEQLWWWVQCWALALPLAGVAAYRHWKKPWVRQWVLCFSLTAAYHVWVGGDLQPNQGSRFLLPSLPFLLILAAEGAAIVVDLLLRPSDSGGLRRGLCTALCLLAVLTSNSTVSTSEMLSDSRETLLKFYNRRNLANAMFYREFTDPSTIIALHWAGLISYFSHRPVRDVLGKSDRYIARLQVDTFAPGHSKWDWDYELETVKPDIFNKKSRGLANFPKFRSDYVRVDSRLCPEFYIRRDRRALLRDQHKLRFTDMPSVE